MQEMWVPSLSREDSPCKKEVATHSNILAWIIPRTEEPEGYNPWGRKRVGDDWLNDNKLVKQKLTEQSECEDSVEEWINVICPSPSFLCPFFKDDCPSLLLIIYLPSVMPLHDLQLLN